MLSFEQNFGGEVQRFAVPLSTILRIETECGPLGQMPRRVADGDVIVIACVIQSALEGAGMDIDKARLFVNENIPGRIPQAAALAAQILEQATVGIEPDWSSEKAAAETGLLDIQSIWRAASAAGTTPDEVQKWTLAQLQAFFQGIADKHTAPEDRKARPNAAERAAIKDALK